MGCKKQGVAKNWVIVIQKEKRQPGLFSFNNDPVFCTLLFSGPYFGLDFFKVPDPKKISGWPDKLEKWVQIDWTIIITWKKNVNKSINPVIKLAV